jgi:hypothetical protein
MQNKFTASLLLGSVVFIGALTAPADAAPRSKSSREVVTTTSAAPEYGSSKRFGLGLQTLDGASALSGLLELSPQSSLQLLAYVAGTSPSFQFGVGGIYRSTVVGGTNAGLHFGAGAILGTVAGAAAAIGGASSKFFIDLGPVAGVHFTLPNLSAVMVSLDGAALLQVRDSSTNFTIGGLSPAMGLSIHYFM